MRSFHSQREALLQQQVNAYNWNSALSTQPIIQLVLNTLKGATWVNKR